MSEPRETPFEELLARAKVGDREARDRLFERLADQNREGAKLLGIARRILPRTDRARRVLESMDIVQSVLKSALVDVTEFRGSDEKEFYAWLASMLRYKVNRKVRGKGARLQGEGLTDSQVRDIPATRSEGGLNDLLRKETQRRVRAAMERLPEDQRVVVDLRLREMNAPEIAKVLGINPAAVRKRESRANEKLREILGHGLP